MERSLSLRQPPPGSAFARDTARSRSLGRPGGASGLASVLGIQDDLVEVLRDSVAVLGNSVTVLGDSVEVFGIRWTLHQLGSGSSYFKSYSSGESMGAGPFNNTFLSLCFFPMSNLIARNHVMSFVKLKYQGGRPHICFLS